MAILRRLRQAGLALTLLAATAPAVQGATASWDRNPEPNVTGYRLSYGTASGRYDTTIDVGNVTTAQFFPPAGHRYYVVVQAYTSTGEVSAPSAEAVIDIPLTTSPVSALTTTPTIPQSRLRFQSPGSLSGVTALRDGRLLFVESGQSLRLLAPGATARTVLNTSDASASFTETAVNTRFRTSRHVFVGVNTRLDANTSEFAVLRYREVNGTLGEGVAVIGELRFRGSGVPRFSIDEDERVYVAMPESDRSDPYSAVILRFNPGGTVPADNLVASPVVARGFSRPSNLGWDGQVLVAIGADEHGSYSAAALKADPHSDSWPQSLRPVLVGHSNSVVMAAFSVGDSRTVRGVRAFIDASQRLFRASSGAGGSTVVFDEIPLPTGFVPVSVAAGFEGQTYVVVCAPAGESYLVELASAR
jgi:hypothetical protein